MKLATLLFAASSIVLSTVAPVFAADTLANLLAMIADGGASQSPLVAEGTAEIDGIKGKAQDRLTIVERAGADAKAPSQIFVAFDSSKTRFLGLGPKELFVATSGNVAAAKPNTPVTPTSFNPEDFLSFSPERCAAMRIADTADEHYTIVCEPKIPPSQYMLLVYKFDREKSVPRQVLIYKDQQTNLVRFLKFDEFQQVAGTWRPKKIILRDFKLRTEDTLTVNWRAEPKVAAELFDAKAFGGAPLPPAAKAPAAKAP